VREGEKAKRAVRRAIRRDFRGFLEGLEWRGLKGEKTEVRKLTNGLRGGAVGLWEDLRKVMTLGRSFAAISSSTP
jgi:hypothetical protein